MNLDSRTHRYKTEITNSAKYISWTIRDPRPELPKKSFLIRNIIVTIILSKLR